MGEGEEVVVFNETEKPTQVLGRMSPKKRVTWKWVGGGRRKRVGIVLGVKFSVQYVHL